MSDVAFIVNGAAYRGWSEVSVQRTIDALSGTFSFALFEGLDQVDVREDDECEIKIDSALVMSGVIDSVAYSLGPNQHRIRVAGRERTARAVKSSARPSAWQYKGPNALSYLGTLHPKVAVQNTSGTPLRNPPVLSVEQGDTVFDVIDRVARYSGLLPVATPAGGVDFVAPGSGGKAGASIVEGENLLSCEAAFDNSERYGRVVVTGTGPRESAPSGGYAHPAVKGEAVDTEVADQDTVLHIPAREQISKAAADARAKWEVSVRAARAFTAAGNVRGWRAGDALWPINALVPVRIPTARLQGDLLISGVEYVLSDAEGEITRVTLARPDAYAPEPPEQRKWRR